MTELRLQTDTARYYLSSWPHLYLYIQLEKNTQKFIEVQKVIRSFQ